MVQPAFSSIVITGGDEEARLKKAEDLIGLAIRAQTNNPDFLCLELTEDKTSLGIEEIRDIQKFLRLKPYSQERKQVVIREAQNLTIEAQNALLKTLEEPPPSSVIILTVPEPSLLLPTVISRCQIVQLALQSQVTLTKEELAVLDQTFTELRRASLNHRFSQLESLGVYKDRGVAEKWLNELTFLVRNLLIDNYQKKDNLNFSISQLLNYLKLIAKTKRLLKANCNVRLVLDCFLLDLK